MNEREIELVEVEGRMPGASNFTLLARDAEGTEWIYKPEAGERPLWDFPPGSLAAREVACYRTSEALGLRCVPETVFAWGPFGRGSAQRFLDEDLEWDPRHLIVGADPSLWTVAVLDIVANNADRKAGHLLRVRGETDPARIWAIDNGLTFHSEDKLRTVLWSFAEREIPGHMIAALDIQALAGAIEDVLEPAEVDSTITRMQSLIDHPYHPLPPTDRPAVPWPLW